MVLVWAGIDDATIGKNNLIILLANIDDDLDQLVNPYLVILHIVAGPSMEPGEERYTT